jgi:hypothetical protein
MMCFSRTPQVIETEMYSTSQKNRKKIDKVIEEKEKEVKRGRNS